MFYSSHSPTTLTFTVTALSKFMKLGNIKRYQEATRLDFPFCKLYSKVTLQMYKQQKLF